MASMLSLVKLPLCTRLQTNFSKSPSHFSSSSVRSIKLNRGISNLTSKSSLKSKNGGNEEKYQEYIPLNRRYISNKSKVIGGNYGRIIGQFTKKKLQMESQIDEIADEASESYLGKVTVALVGRPNVGKSTLFNIIIEKGQKKAIVTKIPGTTRDRSYGNALYLGREFTLVDTGGIVGFNPNLNEKDQMMNHIRDQTLVAMSEASIIIFLLDIQDGVTNQDVEMARFLRTKIMNNKSEPRKVVVAVNKADNIMMKDENKLEEIKRLGLGDPIAISAIHSDGISDLLDQVVEDMDPVEEVDKVIDPAKENQPYSIRVALVGLPNVGKSSMLNKMIKQERSIVSEIEGTTHDPIDFDLEVNGRMMTLVDTAGIRKKTIRNDEMEQLMVLKALRTIEDSHVTILLIDPVKGVTSQDQKLASHILQNYKSVIVAINKWDLLRDKPDSKEEYMKHIRAQLKFLQFVPVEFCSAKTGYRAQDLLDLAQKVFDERSFKFPTKKLNDTIRAAVMKHSPPSTRGKSLKIKFASQIKSFPPTFVFFVNDTSLLEGHFKRYLEGSIRERHPYLGTPIRLLFRNNKGKEASWKDTKNSSPSSSPKIKISFFNEGVKLGERDSRKVFERDGEWGLEDIDDDEMSSIIDDYKQQVVENGGEEQVGRMFDSDTLEELEPRTVLPDFDDDDTIIDLDFDASPKKKKQPSNKKEKKQPKS